MITISREQAFRVASQAIPELDVLSEQRPEYRDLVREIRGFLAPSITRCQVFREDARAIGELSRALGLAAKLLSVPMSLARDGGHDGVLASLQTSLLSLAATLLGQRLPDSTPMTAASLARAG